MRAKKNIKKRKIAGKQGFEPKKGYNEKRILYLSLGVILIGIIFSLLFRYFYDSGIFGKNYQMPLLQEKEITIAPGCILKNDAGFKIRSETEFYRRFFVESKADGFAAEIIIIPSVVTVHNPGEAIKQQYERSDLGFEYALFEQSYTTSGIYKGRQWERTAYTAEINRKTYEWSVVFTEFNSGLIAVSLIYEISGAAPSESTDKKMAAKEHILNTLVSSMEFRAVR